MSGALIHPAAARRMARKLPPRPHHDVTLRALGRSGDPQGRLAIFEEADFLAALWADLRSADWRERLDAREPDAASRLRLPLPIHRQTVVVLYEIACAMPGRPRLAQGKIKSMGLVIRRPATQKRGLLGWRKAQGTPLGWQIVDPDDAVDPDPTRRMPLAPGRNPEVLERVSARRNTPGLPAEEIIALQAVPADICADLGRTILFAVLPLASAESSPAIQDAFDYNALDAADEERMNALYGWPWREGGAVSFEQAGDILRPAWTAPGTARDPLLAEIATLLRQTTVECGMGDAGSAANALRNAFATITLPMRENADGAITQTMPADSWLMGAAPILLGQENNTANLAMPLRWPARSAATAARLKAALRDCLTEQARRFQPDTPKFDDPRWRYHIRPFLRLRHGPDCPIRLSWGAPSAEFGIRAWWDSDAPPHKISLPGLDRLKDLKPNIAFEMPPELAAMMAKDPADLMEGKGDRPAKTGIGFLCCFSLPIITICAFIALNIFLQLFNFFFRWMLWIKICIPIPTKKGDE